MSPLQMKTALLCLCSGFLLASTYYRSNDGLLVSWPNIPAGEDTIEITGCLNFLSVPGLAVSGRPDLRDVWLSNNAIIEINKTWLRNSPTILSIWLFGNKLTSIPAFNCGPAGGEGCPELREIDLSSNLIVSVPTRSFANHSKLVTLNLQSNSITTLDSHWIVDCMSVKFLNIYNNAKLQTFPISIELSVRGLGNLEYLLINNCNISSLSPDFLFFFPNLKRLQIKGNPINILPKFVPSHPVKIQVGLMTNFLCDCSTTKLAKNGMIESTSEIGFCGSPNYNVWKTFLQLECRNETFGVLRKHFELTGNATFMERFVPELSDGDVHTCIKLHADDSYRLQVDGDSGWSKREVVGVNVLGGKLRCDEKLDVMIQITGERFFAKCNPTWSSSSACGFRCECRQNEICKSIFIHARTSSAASLCYISVG